MISFIIFIDRPQRHSIGMLICYLWPYNSLITLTLVSLLVNEHFQELLSDLLNYSICMMQIGCYNTVCKYRLTSNETGRHRCWQSILSQCSSNYIEIEIMIVSNSNLFDELEYLWRSCDCHANAWLVSTFCWTKRARTSLEWTSMVHKVITFWRSPGFSSPTSKLTRLFSWITWKFSPIKLFLNMLTINPN